MRFTALPALLGCASLPGSVAQVARSSRDKVQAPVPYALAAVWAADRVPKSCDEQTDQCNWGGARDAWRYALNNLRLAMESASEDDKQWLPLDQLQQLQGIVSQLGQDMGMWYGNWGGQFGGFARELVDQMSASGWVDRVGSIPLAVPRTDVGTWFPSQRRSLSVPTDGDTGATVTLANGFQLPVLGFGTWQIPADGTTYQSVKWALQSGYRHIDTAQAYGNEHEVGAALQDFIQVAGVPRSEICLVTKLSNPNDYFQARSRFENQLQILGVTYIDVYMLHSPGPSAEGRKKAWQELERLYDEGRIKALGVSNFGIELLEELLAYARIRPVYLQNKYSIYQPGSRDEAVQSESLMEWLTREKIVMTGYSIIHPGHGGYLSPMEDPHVKAIAQRHGKTASQVLHRWLLQLGAVVIPRSTKLERIRENADLFSFALPESDMRLINGISTLLSSDLGKHAPAWCDDVYELQALK